MPDGLSVDRLSASWDRRPVLQDITFRVEDGEFVTLMGPNGSGKTTLLRALVGLEPLDGGEIRLGGARLNEVPTHRRGIGLLFQEPTLLPRRTVRENVAFGPEIQGVAPAEVDARVDEMLLLLHLRALGDRPEHALSGGERQRVALARTLAARPRLVLLDEPFASVDPELRADLRAEFRSVLRSRGITVIHVTHDRDEGLFLGDRVLLLAEGRLVQSGVPDEVYRRPRTRAVARFLGYNLLRRGSGWAAVHPADVRLAGGPDSRPATVVASGSVGRGWIAYLTLADGERWESRGGADELRPAAGASVSVQWSNEIPLEDSDLRSAEGSNASSHPSSTG
ncbi:MAG: ABC transporter ATP-binding protein [Thermoplasmata archaeon]|nr:ABC transporter ATP-binding protein [Thermoplasmata archaeon]